MANRALTRNGEAFVAETVGSTGTSFMVTHTASGRKLTAGWSRKSQSYIVLDATSQVLSKHHDAAMRKMCDRLALHADRKEALAGFFRATRTRELRDPCSEQLEHCFVGW